MSNARPRSGQQKPPAARTTEGVVPVVQEELVVEKQTRETGHVVVHVTPQVREQRIEVALAREDVQVERVPVNRAVDVTQPPRQEGDVTIVPVYEEVLVTEKRLVLKEEIRITRRRTVHHETREVPLRSEEAQIVRGKVSPS